MNKTLYCVISDHGFGHIAQTDPVLNRLVELRPDINIVIQSQAPESLLRERFDFSFTLVRATADRGMIMNHALQIDAKASHDYYRQRHQHWQQQVKEAATFMQAHRPDLVYSNIDYLANAAAASLSIPVINLCSLNWYQIYQSYCGHMPGAAGILKTMAASYNLACEFLMPEPSMPMPEIRQSTPIGMIAHRGENVRSRILQLWQLPTDIKLALVSFGGHDFSLDLQQWPTTPGWVYLVKEYQGPPRADIKFTSELNLPYIDILSTVDVIMTKTGYGTFAEAACNQTDVLYIARPDWPEDRYLSDWLQAHARCQPLAYEQLLSGNLQAVFEQLNKQPIQPAAKPTGVEQAATVLSAKLQ